MWDCNKNQEGIRKLGNNTKGIGRQQTKMYTIKVHPHV